MAEKRIKYKALSWFIFSGISTFLAFFLPLHLWATINGYPKNNYLLLPVILLWDLLLICALYHGKYRLKTLLADLGIKKNLALFNIIIESCFYFAIVALAFVSIILNNYSYLYWIFRVG